MRAEPADAHNVPAHPGRQSRVLRGRTGHHGAMARAASAGWSRTGGGSLLSAVVVLVALAVVLPLVAACTNRTSEPSEADHPSDAALRVSTGHGSGLDEADLARLEPQVSDVLARYVQAGFLGDYPRTGFVQSFADFTSAAAQQAVADIDVLTASRFAEASSVRATDLGVRLSFLVVDSSAIGASAWIDFAFDVVDHGTRRTVTLGGRLVLEHREGRWSVFAYQVHRSDSDTVPTEASST